MATSTASLGWSSLDNKNRARNRKTVTAVPPDGNYIFQESILETSLSLHKGRRFRMFIGERPIFLKAKKIMRCGFLCVLFCQDGQILETDF